MEERADRGDFKHLLSALASSAQRSWDIHLQGTGSEGHVRNDSAVGFCSGSHRREMHPCCPRQVLNMLIGVLCEALCAAPQDAWARASAAHVGLYTRTRTFMQHSRTALRQTTASATPGSPMPCLEGLKM